MIRKIVQHGNSTLTISLPYRWTKEHHLKKGDELILEQIGKNLLIKQEKDTKGALHVSVYKKNQIFLKRDLLNFYRKGYDDLILQFKDETPLEEIYSVLEELLGFEIIEQTDSRCHIKNVANVMEDEFETMLRRLFVVVRSFSDIMHDSMEADEPEKSIKALSMEKEVNKLTNYCKRVLNRTNLGDISQITATYSLTNRLELIGDSLAALCRYFGHDKPEVSTAILNFHADINEYFNQIQIQYFKTEKDVVRLKQLRAKLYLDFIDIGKSQTTDSIIFANLKQILEELHHIEISL
ncbi:hypothetical protein COV93_05125 [Candidatus Woesearchaeota archaeon CG11_big_fil_rev_8_21_14_0_20_43_8]|nr:MAG: hypothetical protein COV93_05125 [Candidatus Woesearchaeota archaeon CG11_big_fil_rev_8_21_14_0_20_43_8]PIO04577.1 MAG: hypothetical protein COT47_08415 [Candidatus Woesearchaeota archaeon CG08_land_8_20_14_0_20_43_7]